MHHNAASVVGSTVVVERSVRCADGRQHYGKEYLQGVQVADVITIADANKDVPWCGGAPHHLAKRQHITTPWERDDA